MSINYEARNCLLPREHNEDHAPPGGETCDGAPAPLSLGDETFTTRCSLPKWHVGKHDLSCTVTKAASASAVMTALVDTKCAACGRADLPTRLGRFAPGDDLEAAFVCTDCWDDYKFILVEEIHQRNRAARKNASTTVTGIVDRMRAAGFLASSLESSGDIAIGPDGEVALCPQHAVGPSEDLKERLRFHVANSISTTPLKQIMLTFTFDHGLSSLPECPGCAGAELTSETPNCCAYCRHRHNAEPIGNEAEDSEANRAAAKRIAAFEKRELARNRPTATQRELAKGHPSTWPSNEGEP